MKYQFRLTSPMKDVDELLEPNMIGLKISRINQGFNFLY